jgi:hypothetical protein
MDQTLREISRESPLLFAVFAVIFFLFPAYQDYSDAARLASDYVSAEATVIAKDCSSHSARTYEFRAMGQPFQGQGSSETGGNCEALRMGDRVTVFYERVNPANNSGAQPDLALREAQVYLAFAFLPSIILPIGIFIWRFGLARTR